MCSEQESSQRGDATSAVQRVVVDAPDQRNAAILELQERERLRIGFDLHDGPVQSLSAALLQLRLLQDGESEDGDIRPGLDQVRETLKNALAEMYALIDDLGCRTPQPDGLLSPVRSHVASFAERYGMPCELRVEGPETPVSRSLQIAIARIVQEALSNVGQHSGASSADVRLVLSEESVFCEITDDGRGFSAEDVVTKQDRRERYGLMSMRERTKLLDGQCEIHSAPGHGTRISVRIPIWRG